MPVAALIPAAIGGIASLVQGKKAKSAATTIQQGGQQYMQGAQQQAGQTQQTGTGVIGRMKDMYTAGMGQYQPYSEMGTQGVKALSDFLGLGGGGATGGAGTEAFKFDPSAIQIDPGLDYRLKEGMKAIERSAAAKGNIFAGGTTKAIMGEAQDMASQEYQNAYARAFSQQMAEYQSKVQAGQNIYNRLFGVTGLGENAAAAQAGLGQWFGNQAGAIDMATQEAINNLLMGGQNALLQGTGAQASGQIAQGNAWANALNATGNAVGGMLNYKRLSDLLGQQAGGGIEEIPSPQLPPWWMNVNTSGVVAP